MVIDIGLDTLMRICSTMKYFVECVPTVLFLLFVRLPYFEISISSDFVNCLIFRFTSWISFPIFNSYMHVLA